MRVHWKTLSEHSDAIRNLSLAGKNKEIRSLLISPEGLKVFEVLKEKREATSKQIAEVLDMQSTHVSVILVKLYKQGYIRRDARPHKGNEFNYYL